MKSFPKNRNRPRDQIHTGLLEEIGAFYEKERFNNIARFKLLRTDVCIHDELQQLLSFRRSKNNVGLVNALKNFHANPK